MNSQVEQVDREAAAKLLGGAAPEGLLSGRKDTLSVVQAFAAHRLAALASQPPVLDEREVIDMVLYCPACGVQHTDEPDARTPDWSNPPHRSHLCHDCGCIWRPADVATNGVSSVKTAGKADTWGWDGKSLAGAAPAIRNLGGPDDVA